MTVPGLFAWLRAPRTRDRSARLDFLHSREGFRDILEVERMRSDRTGASFALVVFTLPNSDAPAKLERAFAAHLDRRRRATDHVGRMHARHLGVVLWNTSEAGAWQFARDVLDGWRGGAVPECDVYLYPTHVPPAQSNGSARADADASGRSAERSFEEAEIAETPAAVGVFEYAGTRSLEPLFVRRLPFWKRTLDVAGAAFGLVVLAPPLLLIAAVVKWTSPGPVLFAQRRTGLAGRQFTIYKFRTMCNDAEAMKDDLRRHSEQDGPAFKMTNDPRITPVGRVLRKTCLDELPQLWNVLVGDMTLVGPRPLDVNEARHTSGWERRRLDVTPGLTCIWQVEGKSKVTFAEWMRMDIRYSRARSAWLDLSLVVRTLFAMLRSKASQ